MRHPTLSGPWLSQEMAHALAAMYPPLLTMDVRHAADTLRAHKGATHAIDHLLRQGSDLMTARQVIETLRALRDVHVTDSDLANWLIVRERSDGSDTLDPAVAAEQVCQKLFGRLSTTISAAGSQALLSRALHLARAEFGFLHGIRAGKAPEPCLVGLSERTDDVESGEAEQALTAVLSTVLDLIIGFIGGELTGRLVREVWPDLPVRAPLGPVNSNGQEAVS